MNQLYSNSCVARGQFLDIKQRNQDTQKLQQLQRENLIENTDCYRQKCTSSKLS